MKDIKHIRRIFVHSELGVRGGGGGGLGVNFFPKFNQIWCVRYLHEWHMQQHNFGSPWGGCQKVIYQLQSQFHRFLNKTLCVFSQMKYIKHIRRVPWVMHQGLGLEGAGGQTFNFLNMVMWHIKLKGMSSSPGYTGDFYPRIKLVTLGCGQRVKYH